MLASVIVCMRNERENILYVLRDLVQQHFDDEYEIIVVNDFSTDDSFEKVKEFSAVHPKIRFIDLSDVLPDKNRNIPNKKAGIAIAVQSASGKYMVTTDADCRMGNLWLKAIVETAQQNSADMICGPVKIENGKTLLQRFQEIDLAVMMAITRLTIENKIPVLCNGANLLYLKSAFDELNPYAENINEHSGDDIFLLQKFNEHQKRILFASNPNAIVTTKAQQDFISFFHQRIRWAGKSKSYKSAKGKLFVILIYLANLCGAVMFVAAFFDLPWLLLFLSVFSFKAIADFLIIKDELYFFGKKRLIPLLPFFELMHIFYVVIFGIFSLRKSYIWKDRKVHR